ncbi:hypothetical protein AVEN_234788-1 [Araneus ventricosus]|uniref:BED-type domain-containing protein n=1 Tax=Araneus ventricosus TaxID=182803 RepID=A0A4Y2F6D5_ARAVE|nr:hypothetical protein AVEN_234788-1 [Araneus ventricosus]
MASNRTDIVYRSREVDVRDIDKGVKNPWKWDWLEKEINGTFLHETIRKLDRCGVAYCLACKKELIYGSRGFIALTDHIKSRKHASGLQRRQENTAITGAGSSNSKDLSYGVHPMFSKVTVAPPALPEPLTSFSDRTVNSEAMLVSFLAEKSLPLSLAPDILELTKALAKDKKVLGQMTIHRTAASYKLQHGVAKTFQ